MIIGAVGQFTLCRLGSRGTVREKKVAAFIDGKPEAPGPLHELQLMNMVLGVKPVTVAPTIRHGLMVANGFQRQSTRLRGFPDVHNATLLNLSALLTTETDDRLMAAAAIIGDNRMPKNGYSRPAAIGTPAEL